MWKSIRSLLSKDGRELQHRNRSGSAPAAPTSPTGSLRWGPLALPPEEAAQHFAAIGATGSGKTTILRLLLQDVVPTIGPQSESRMLIFDPKQDVVPLLRGINPRAPLVITNPFDQRGAAWNLARDIREPRVATEMAITLIPKEQESQPFFSDAARHLLGGVLTSFMWRELDFSFGDVLRALMSARLLKRVLWACPHTKYLIGWYFYDKKLLGSVLSTIATKVAAYMPIAACWDTATSKFSIEDWIRNEYTLVLGCSETSRHTIDAINSCIFKRACDLTLEQRDSKTRRSWFVIDEVSESGKISGLGPLAKKGRSKGAAVVLAFQSIEGLRHPNSFGPQLAADILGQVGHRFIGRLECPETAAWASKLIGDQEIRQFTVSHSYSRESSTTVNESIVIRPALLPSEFLTLPTCDPTNGLSAIYACRNQSGVIVNTLSGHELFNNDLIPFADNVPGFLPRPPESQYLRKWTPGEEADFAPEPPAKRNKRSKKAPATDVTGLLAGMDGL